MFTTENGARHLLAQRKVLGTCCLKNGAVHWFSQRWWFRVPPERVRVSLAVTSGLAIDPARLAQIRLVLRPQDINLAVLPGAGNKQLALRV